MKAIILSIGDELVLGQTVDTNSAWLSQQLAAIGVSVLSHTTVGDDQESIERAIRAAARPCDVLIISGGIGPTPDDLTRQALAAVMRQPLELNEHWLSFLQDFFKKRNREMPEMNKIQAMIPRGAKIILNSCGTAAGIEAELKFPDYILPRPAAGNTAMEQMFGQAEMARRAYADKDLSQRSARIFGKGIGDITRIFVIPGVPSEMKAMFTRDILPSLSKQSGGGVILSRTLHTFGLGESAIAQMLGDLMDRKRNPTVGTTVANGIVSVRVNSKFESREEAEKQLAETESACRGALGELIFGADEQTLQEVVGHLLHELTDDVATAESCTGGLLAKLITDVSGSSGWFSGGWIVYSNDAKNRELGVPLELLKQWGAVSEPVVIAMADGAREKASTNHALAISGIAGPTGGTAEKPVGTVCIALSSESKTVARTFNFAGDREMIRDRSAKMALTMLRFHLLGKALPF